MAASIYDWSNTAIDNATADSGITWAEGQLPSTVNDSARTMMKRAADLLDDLGYGIVATGSANAIAVSTSAAFAALATGLMIGFKAASANTAATTLNVNGIGAKKLIKITAAGEADLAANDILAGSRCFVHYDSTADTGTGAWILHDGNINMSRAGGTFTGQIITAAGSASAPAIGIGDDNSGFYNISGNQIGLAHNGILAWSFTTGTTTYSRAGGTTSLSVVSDGSVANYFCESYAAAAGINSLISRHARGTLAAPASVINSDVLFRGSGQGHDGTSFDHWGVIDLTVFEAVPGTAAHGTKFVVQLCPPGSATLTSDALTFELTNGLRFSGNTVVTASRHPQLRSYTVATVPAATTAAQLIYVSNENGGATPAFSDGSNWRRVHDRAVVTA